MSQVNLPEGDRRVVLEAIGSDKLDRPVTNDDLREFERVIYEPDSDEYRKQQRILAQAFAQLTSTSSTIIPDDEIDPQLVYQTLGQLKTAVVDRNDKRLLNWAKTYIHWDKVLQLTIRETGHRGDDKFYKIELLVEIAALGVKSLKKLLLNTSAADLLKTVDGDEAAAVDLDVDLIRLGHEGVLETHLKRVSSKDSNSVKSFKVLIYVIDKKFPGIQQQFEARLSKAAYTNASIRRLMAGYGHQPTLNDLAKDISQFPYLAKLYRGARDSWEDQTLKKEKLRQALLTVNLTELINTPDLLNDRENLYLDVLNEIEHPGLEIFLASYVYEKNFAFSFYLIGHFKERPGPILNFLKAFDLNRLRIESADGKFNQIPLLSSLAEIGHSGVANEIDRLFETKPETLKRNTAYLTHAAFANDGVFNVVARRAAESPFMLAILYFIATNEKHPKSKAAAQAIRNLDISKYVHLNGDERIVRILWESQFNIWHILARFGNEDIYRILSRLDSKDLHEYYFEALSNLTVQDVPKLGEACFMLLGKLAETDVNQLSKLRSIVELSIEPQSGWAKQYFDKAARINPQAGSLVNLLRADVSYYIERLGDPHPLEKEDVYWKALIHVYQFKEPRSWNPFHRRGKNEAAHAFVATLDEERIQQLIDQNPIWLARAMDLGHLNRAKLIERNIHKYSVAAFMAIQKVVINDDMQRLPLSKVEARALNRLVISLNADFFRRSIENIPQGNSELADHYIAILRNLYLYIYTEVVSYHPPYPPKDYSYHFWESIAYAFRIHKGRVVRGLVQNTIPKLYHVENTHPLLKKLAIDLMVSVAETDPTFPEYGNLLEAIQNVAPERLAKLDLSAIKKAASEGNVDAMKALLFSTLHIKLVQPHISQVLIEAVIQHSDKCLDMFLNNFIEFGAVPEILLEAAKRSKNIRDLLEDKGRSTINGQSLARFTYDDSRNYIRDFFTGNTAVSTLLLAGSLLTQSDLMDQVPTTSAINTIEHVAQAETDPIDPSKTQLPLSVDLNTQDSDLANWKNINLTPPVSESNFQRREHDVRTAHATRIHQASMRRTAARNAAMKRIGV